MTSDNPRDGTIRVLPGSGAVKIGIEKGGFTLHENLTPDEADELAEDLRDVAENVRKMRQIAENRTKEEN